VERAVGRLAELILRRNIKPLLDSLKEPESDSAAIEVTVRWYWRVF
jgi:hypothetical protein